MQKVAISISNFELLEKHIAGWSQKSFETEILELVNEVFKISQSKVSLSQLGIIFATLDSIKALNKSFRKKDEATDVLSFNYENGTCEIYICVSFIVKRLQEENAAKEISLKQELFRMLVHGLLHILDYDHKSHLQWNESGQYSGDEEMYKLQEEVLKRLGANR